MFNYCSLTSVHLEIDMSGEVTPKSEPADVKPAVTSMPPVTTTPTSTAATTAPSTTKSQSQPLVRCESDLICCKHPQFWDN